MARKIPNRSSRTRSGLSADLLRGIVLTGVVLAVSQPFVESALRSWSIDAQLSRAVVVAIAASVMAGAAWKIFHGVGGARWFFLGGLVVGLAIMATK